MARPDIEWEVRVRVPAWKEGEEVDALSVAGPLSEIEATRIARRYNEGSALGYYAHPKTAIDRSEARMARPDIEAIAKRADKATRGQWHYTGVDIVPRVRTGGPEMGCTGYLVAECSNSHLSETVANAEFIAHAREDVPALLAYIGEQDAEIAALRNAGVAAYLGWRHGWDIAGPLHRLRDVVKPTEAEDAAYRERMGIEEEARRERIEEYNATVEADATEP